MLHSVLIVAPVCYYEIVSELSMRRYTIGIQAAVVSTLILITGLLLLGGALGLRRLGKAEIVTRKIQIWEGMRYGGSGGARDYERFICEALPMPVDYAGRITAPKKVYIGDSHNISFVLEQIYRPYHEGNEALIVEDTVEGKWVRLRIPIQPGKANALRVELQAAGVTVDGERRQEQQLLASRKLEYYWNCHFPNSGSLTLSFRLIAWGPSVETDFGVMNHPVKVTRFNHLTQRQERISAFILGIVGFVATLWGAINGFVQFIHLAGWH